MYVAFLFERNRRCLDKLFDVSADETITIPENN